MISDYFNSMTVIITTLLLPKLLTKLCIYERGSTYLMLIRFRSQRTTVLCQAAMLQPWMPPCTATITAQGVTRTQRKPRPLTCRSVRQWTMWSLILVLPVPWRRAASKIIEVTQSLLTFWLFFFNSTDASRVTEAAKYIFFRFSLITCISLLKNKVYVLPNYIFEATKTGNKNH